MTNNIQEKEMERNFKEYQRIQELLDTLTKQKKALREEILQQMTKLKKGTVYSDYGTFTLVDSYTRTGVDIKHLEQCYPNVFQKVKTTKKVSRSIKYTQTKKGDNQNG